MVLNIIRTMKIHSPFRIGIILLIIGIMWAAIVFSGGVKGSESTSFTFKQSEEFELKLEGQGIGFYKVTISDYDHDILYVQITDPLDNVIGDQKISTKMSVNYFDYDIDGNYIIKITNLAERDVQVTIEYGDTRSSELLIPGIISSAGVVFIIFAAFMKIKSHRMAHPEERT